MEQLKLIMLRFKEWGTLLLIGLGAFLGWKFFIQKQKPENLPERPPRNPDIEIPERPKSLNWQEKLQESLDDIRKKREDIKTHRERVKMLNKNAKKRTKK